MPVKVPVTVGIPDTLSIAVPFAFSVPPVQVPCAGEAERARVGLERPALVVEPDVDGAGARPGVLERAEVGDDVARRLAS